MQTRRKESRKEGRSYRNKKATVLLDDPTLSIYFPEIAARFIESEIEDSKLRRWVADAVSRTIFMIAFACVRLEEDRPRQRGRSREGRHSAVSSGRRVHNTDASIILEILPGMKREQERRTSSHAYVWPCTHARIGPSRLPTHYPEESNFIPRNIEPWRDISLLRSDRSSSKTMDLSISQTIKIFFTRAITLNINDAA